MNPKIKTNTIATTYEHLTNALRTNKRLFFTRFGDGDFYILNKKGYKNHDYSERLHSEMEEAISIDDSQYIISSFLNYQDESKEIQRFFFTYPDNSELYDVLNEKYNAKGEWIFENCNTLPYYALFEPTIFYNFLEEFIRPKKKLLIGGIHPNTAQKLYGNIDEYVATPMKSAYKEIDSWWPEVIKKVENVDLVLPAAGAASKIINKRLWDIGYNRHSLDIGSIIDAIDGLPTRKWIRLKGHKINDLLLPEYRKTNMAFKTEYLYKEIFYEMRNFWKNLSEK